MRAILVTFLFLLPFHVNAESVLQAKGKNFLFEAGMYKNGDTLTIFGADGRPKGSARVKQAGKSKSLAEVTSGSVAAGDTVGFDTGGASAGGGSGKSSGGSRAGKFIFGAGLGLEVMSSSKMSGTFTAGGSTYDISGSGKAGTGFGIMGEAQYWFSDMIAAIGGFDYMMEKSVDAGLSFTISNPAYTVSSLTDKISAMIFSGGASFRFNKLYFPVSLNYPMVTYKSTSTVQVAGAIGFQFGGGYMITNNLAAEFMYRILNYQVRLESSTVTVIFTKAEQSNMMLAGKYYF